MGVCEAAESGSKGSRFSRGEKVFIRREVVLVFEEALDDEGDGCEGKI